MTNYEYIKNMTVEEMATLINRIGYFPCEYCEYTDSPGDSPGCGTKCAEGIKNFLESEVEEND